MILKYKIKIISWTSIKINSTYSIKIKLHSSPNIKKKYRNLNQDYKPTTPWYNLIIYPQYLMEYLKHKNIINIIHKKMLSFKNNSHNPNLTHLKISSLLDPLKPQILSNLNNTLNNSLVKIKYKLLINY
jgi:hypothetical protein